MWIQFYNDFNRYKERIMVILGNKIDKEGRVVSYKEAKKYADEQNLLYYETSAITMQNVNEAFKEMIEMILKAQNSNKFVRTDTKKKLEKESEKKCKDDKKKKNNSSGGCC